MAENKRYTNQKKQNSGQDSVIKNDLYLFSIPSGSENDYTLVINPQSKQVRYVLLANSAGGAGTSGTSGSVGSSGSSGQSQDQELQVHLVLQVQEVFRFF
jgi:hypothetical protein